MQKRKRKSDKIREKKKTKEAKKYTQALREVKFAYTKKNAFSLEVNTVILEAF